ncbi:4400_t:CDS:1, partial [Paraglomus occultum]
QEVNYIAVANNELRVQESKLDIEMIHRSDSSNTENNMTNIKMEVERIQLPENSKSKELLNQMEEVQETKEEEINMTNSY